MSLIVLRVSQAGFIADKMLFTVYPTYLCLAMQI